MTPERAAKNEIDPATAPTVPGHGPSSIPRKDAKMNEVTNTTAGAREAMPSRFDGMTLQDMRNLFDGVQAAHHVLLTNEWNANGSSLTGSYLWFKVEAERLNNLMQEIASAALDRQTYDDEDDAWEREQILIRAKPFRMGHRRYRTLTQVELLA
ncbi:hypothetical protein GR138_26700 [Shinella kummerowiae]|uniref:Uncharacterized protein n=1 Tax=Shinella kummerowiae TaxID=417745 RepID=A0A6N8SK06_9HYPH|nr:hypothetical protein [Shinella kummerowiae]MXN48793.1 hypothetical protein [Shinella kummerowiae]